MPKDHETPPDPSPERGREFAVDPGAGSVVDTADGSSGRRERRPMSVPFLSRFALPARRGSGLDTLKTDVVRETTDDQ